MSGRNLLAPKEQAEPKPGRNLFKQPSLAESLKTMLPEAQEDLDKYGYRPDLPWERQSRRFRDYYESQADRELQGRRALLGPFAENDTTENLTSRAKALAAKNEFKLPGRSTPEPKMGMGQAFITGAADVGRLVPGGKQIVQSMGEAAVGDPSLDYSKVIDDSTTRALVDRPMTTRGGQIATLLAPGAAITKGVTAAPRIAGALMSPAVAARLAGKSLLAQGARYTGRGAVLGGAGVADYYLYNAAAESGNVAKLEGQETPDLGQRLGYANSQVLTPGGLIAAGTGPLISGAFRTGRAAVAGTKNLATTGTLRRAIPQQGAKPQIVGTRSDLFTPTDVQGRVMAGGLKADQPSPQTGRTPTEEAYDLLLAKGLDPDKTEALVKLVSYDRYADVDEMLFELAGMVDGAADIDQLAVALARVGGDSNRIFREGFKNRNAEMPDRIRVALRDALGLSGDDLEDFGRQMAAKAKEASSEGYTAAYGKQVSDESWAKIYQRLLDTTDGFSPNLTNDVPDAIAAARAGAREARATANGDKAQLEAARQLDELAGALAGRAPGAKKLSTHALDFLDRGFGSRIADASRGTQRSLIGLQKAIRQSGLDADTGLNIPRTIYAQHMAAQKALTWAAERAAKKAVSLRDLKNQFLAAQKAADEAFEEGIGEGRSVIDQSLVMGWLRGSEDLIEMADNPSSLIRQIYGSERQRQKLLEMMPDTEQGVTKPGGVRMAADETGTGDRGDQTKRIRALVGGKRSDGKGAVESLFDRQRRMLENQGRVSGNSVTGNVNEAITAQGGLVRAADAIARAIMNPAEAARNAALWAVSNAPIFRPAIFKPEVNRELGRILATRGRERLLEVISEIRARQIATGKGPKPPAGTAPAPPRGTPPGGGGLTPQAAQAASAAPIRAGGFAGFGGKSAAVEAARKAETVQDFAEQIVAAKYTPRKIKAEATYDDYVRAETEALQEIAAWSGNGNIRGSAGQQLARSSAGDPTKDVTVLEQVTASILRARGLDPSKVVRARMAAKPTPPEAFSAERARPNSQFDRAYDDRTTLDRFKPTTMHGLSGLRTDAGNAAVGAGVGALGPADSPEERLRNMAGGALLLGAGGRLSRTVGARNALADTATAGASAPKTAQQAARFETPGSPEYEAAIAKGLDMSTPARMARAKEMGFDTETVLYHGTTRDFDQFDLNAEPNMGNASERAVFLTPDPESATDFAMISGSLDGQASPRVMPLVVRGKIKQLTPEDLPELRRPGKSGQLVYRTEPFARIIEQAKREGFAGVKVPNVYDVNRAADQVIIFDPSNIRSVNAAFDPDKAASPILTAGIGGFDITAPGQQIAKGLRALDRRVRSPKDPRLTGPAIGPMPAKVTNAPAIEQVTNPAQAQGQLANALYAANSVTSGGRRGQLAATIKGKAQRYDADLSKRRQDAAGLSAEAKTARDAYNRAQTAYEKAWARLITLRNSRASAAEIQPVADQVARLDTIRKQLQAKIPKQSRVPSGSPVAAARRIAAGIRATRGPMNPSRRQLENLDEVTDLLTNPARVRDAQQASMAKPLGSHERAGQAVFWGGVGGAGAYGYSQRDKDKRR